MIRTTSRFGRLAKWAAHAMGQPAAFGIALTTIVLWAVAGPIFGFSDTWQLVINTGTTIVTFLMVFLIQNTQNKDAEAMHIKPDELIRAIEQARNALLNLEELEEKDLERIRAEYLQLAERARGEMQPAITQR
jgi:low affinity Fe/Cu permease